MRGVSVRDIRYVHSVMLSKRATDVRARLVRENLNFIAEQSLVQIFKNRPCRVRTCKM